MRAEHIKESYYFLLRALYKVFMINVDASFRFIVNECEKRGKPIDVSSYMVFSFVYLNPVEFQT